LLSYFVSIIIHFIAIPLLCKSIIYILSISLFFLSQLQVFVSFCIWFCVFECSTSLCNNFVVVFHVYLHNFKHLVSQLFSYTIVSIDLSNPFHVPPPLFLSISTYHSLQGF
jgi:hypothetical protein